MIQLFQVRLSKDQPMKNLFPQLSKYLGTAERESTVRILRKRTQGPGAAVDPSYGIKKRFDELRNILAEYTEVFEKVIQHVYCLGMYHHMPDGTKVLYKEMWSEHERNSAKKEIDEINNYYTVEDLWDIFFIDLTDAYLELAWDNLRRILAESDERAMSELK